MAGIRGIICIIESITAPPIVVAATTIARVRELMHLVDDHTVGDLLEIYAYKLVKIRTCATVSKGFV